MRGRNLAGNYTNPCLTMHQPWASLLVYGIKRIEGRSWPSPIRGRLWIHAASKVPEEATIKAMEEFYREIYAVNGITDLEFPEHYPVSRLVGCVEIVGCVRGEELTNWEELPEGVRLEALTDFCWLCEQPQRLIVPFEMRGFQGVYNLEKKIFEGAVRGITLVKGPLPVKFPLPNPRDHFSLKPGSISQRSPGAKVSSVEKLSSLDAAIAGARAAATQFSTTGQNFQAATPQCSFPDSTTIYQPKGKSAEEDNNSSHSFIEGSSKKMSTPIGNSSHNFIEGSSKKTSTPIGNSSHNSVEGSSKKTSTPIGNSSHNSVEGSSKKTSTPIGNSSHNFTEWSIKKTSTPISNLPHNFIEGSGKKTTTPTGRVQIYRVKHDGRRIGNQPG